MIREDEILAPVLDVDSAALATTRGIAVTDEVVVFDARLRRISAPNAADRVALETILLDAIAEGKRQLQSVRC